MRGAKGEIQDEFEENARGKMRQNFFASDFFRAHTRACARGETDEMK